MQTAELTVNFKSPSWFMKPNNFPSCAQMYDRAVRKIGVPGQSPYGHSCMVLNPKFKINAIYFAGDTFTVNVGLKVSADDQISYDLLGAIYGKANNSLRQAMYKSCILDSCLSDSPTAVAISAYAVLSVNEFWPTNTGGFRTF